MNHFCWSFFWRIPWIPWGWRRLFCQNSKFRFFCYFLIPRSTPGTSADTSYILKYIIYIYRLCVYSVESLELVASLSQLGLKGDVRFAVLENGKVAVKADLQVAEGAEGEYTWGIYEFPIDYTEVIFSTLRDCCRIFKWPRPFIL